MIQNQWLEINGQSLKMCVVHQNKFSKKNICTDKQILCK